MPADDVLRAFASGNYMELYTRAGMHLLRETLQRKPGMQTLSNGARGPEVMLLQRLLNKHFESTTSLREDGIFGPRTEARLAAYQRIHLVPPPPRTAAIRTGHTTWEQLGLRIERVHGVTGVGQPTGMTCWSAAATMMEGNRSVGPGAATLTASGGLATSITNVETFVRGQGWRLINNMTSPPALTVVRAVANGPVWVAFQGNGFEHAVVLSAVYSDGDEDGTGTVFRVHDPWPPNSRGGTVYGTTYLGSQMQLRSVSPPLVAMIAYMAQ